MRKILIPIGMMAGLVAFAFAAPTTFKDVKVTGTMEYTGSPTPGPATVQMDAGSKFLPQPCSAISASDVNWPVAFCFSKTLAGNTTFTFSNLVDGKTIRVFVTNPSTHTVTWPTGIVWEGGVIPAQTTGGKIDEWIFSRCGSTTLGAVRQNFSVATPSPTFTPTATATATNTATATATPTATFTPTPTATATAGFQPDDIAGLKLWLKADAIGGLSDGDPVATWEDSSSTNNDATQATSGFRPTFQTNEINSLPVVRFDGSDDRLEFPTDPGATVSVFVVAALKVAASSQSDYAIFVGANDFQLDAKLTSTQSNNWGTFTTSSNELAAGEVLVVDVFNYLTLTSTSGSSFIYRNGVQKATRSEISTGPSAANYIGGDPGGGGRLVNGDIAEVIIYDTVLSTGDRNSVHAYLAAKYGL